jgi:hypothetical protein
MVRRKRFFNQKGHLKKGAFLMTKNPLILLFPNEPPKEENDSGILSLILLRVSPTDCSYPTLCVTFVKQGESRMYLTILHHSVPDSLRKVAFR